MFSPCCRRRCRKTSWRAACGDADAAVVMKVGRHLPKLRRALRQAADGLARAIYVERGTMADAKMIPLAAKPDDEAPYFAVVLVPGWEETAVSGHLAVVGLGPGDARYLTPEADEALAAAHALYGYGPYLDRVPARASQTRHTSDNREERARAAAALRHAAEGARVAVVSGGDPGVFAMAAAVCEAIEAGPESCRALDVDDRARRHRDARRRGADRRAARPRFLRAVAVRQSQAVGR